jgi:hypothetical protein
VTPPIKVNPRYANNKSAAQLEQEINHILEHPDVEKAARASYKAMHRKLRRKARSQTQYFNCRQLGELVGKHENTIRREFEKEKIGVIKKTFSGRNRKAYTTLLISRAAAKRHYPDLDI